MRTAGLKDCQAGWLLLSLDSKPSYAVIDEKGLAEALGEFGLVFTNVPIGIPEETPWRLCDRELQDRVGGEYAETVVSPPMRVALDAPSYVEANMIYLEATGDELPLASWSQVGRVRLLDRIVRALPATGRICQSDPEWNLTRLNGRRIYQNRETRKGLKHRLELLAGIHSDVEDLFRDLKEEFRRNEVEELDILDAAALASAAARAKEEAIQTLPEEPPADPFGLRMAICYV